MGQRPYLLDEFKSEARGAFAFLVESEGSAEPEDDDCELMYRRSDLAVRLGFYWGRPEHSIWTYLSRIAPDGAEGRGASLEDIYTATGCGPPQDVPGTIHNRRTLLMRVHQHADALRRLLPRLPARFPEP
ncbi:hypothetical protein OG241_42005 [Streptomyces sp. NBC_01390]|uniref:hypothetical protein n=1 Tax=Streptomyces sp. NBC_01390 TaxID=2903850 RepID=UPI003251B80A